MTNVRTHEGSGTHPRSRTARALRVAVTAMFGVATMVAAIPPASATPFTATIPATSGTIGVSWTVGGGNGSSDQQPIVYTVTIDDCTKEPAGSFSDRNIVLNSTTVFSSSDKWFTVDVTCTSGVDGTDFNFDFRTFDLENGSSNTVSGAGDNAEATFQLVVKSTSILSNPEGGIALTNRSDPSVFMQFMVRGFAGTMNTSGGVSGPSPLDLAVATAVEQAAAAGVEGTSAAVLVRDGAVVPVTSTLAPGAGPRGGVVLETEGLTVTVASPVGARAGSGVVVPSGGEMECSLCGAFAPGSVVEAWVNSDPRLTAAVLIPEDAEDGDCHPLVIPTGAPLDGGGAIEDGAHTLQLRMYTDSGFAVLSTGITVGNVMPAGVPAGEGSPVTGGAGVLLALLGLAGFALFAWRREAVTV